MTQMSAPIGVTSRTRLLEGPLGLAECVSARGGAAHRTPEALSPEFQVCLPFRGLFVWHVGGNEVVGDPNQVLFVSGGETYRLSQPLGDGYAELIFTPDVEVLADVAGTSHGRLSSHALFRRRSHRAGLELQRLRAQFLHRVRDNERDHVAGEELMLTILRAALDAGESTRAAAAATQRLVRRAKEFVAAHLCTPFRLRDVAAAVDASPAYLTHVFRRVEGIPLHRYVMQLRLSRALVELPHANDLTTLAFDLGFSSHSHFAAAFRRAFGCTPSHFRGTQRRPGAR